MDCATSCSAGSIRCCPAGRFVARLESGCGTGYLSQLLQKERGWPMVLLDLSVEGRGYTRRQDVQRALQGDVAALPFRGPILRSHPFNRRDRAFAAR